MLHIGMLPAGRTLKLWRREKGFSQEELARQSGIPRPNLSRIEQGSRDMTLATLRRLAAALDIRAGILADGVPPESAAPEKRWSREELDRMARYLAGFSVKLTPREKESAELLRPLILQKIRLKKIEHSRSTLQRGQTLREGSALIAAKSKFQRSEIQSLLNRLDKLVLRVP